MILDALVVCSPGGHFAEARELFGNMHNFKFKYVLHLPPNMPDEIKDKVIVTPHAERDLRLLLQLAHAFYLLIKYKPKIIVSTGAAIAVPFGLVAKILGKKFIFIESPTRINTPSLSARICYKFADIMYIRYKELQGFFPKACFIEG